jgi:hypothetical protein
MLYPRTGAGCPTSPDFLWSFAGSPNFMRLSLMKGAHAGPVESCVQEIGGISLVFCETWDTTALPLKPVAGPADPHESHQNFYAPYR